MTNDEARRYIKENGRFPPGRSRCMDCRCSGKGECAGETLKEQDEWYEIMDNELGGKK